MARAKGRGQGQGQTKGQGHGHGQWLAARVKASAKDIRSLKFSVGELLGAIDRLFRTFQVGVVRFLLPCNSLSSVYSCRAPMPTHYASKVA